MVIKIDELDKVITTELSLYSTQVTNKIKEINDEVTEEFVENTKRDAPKGKRKKKKYYKHITSKTTKETANSKINTWYVKDPEYRLTHLIKNGHATKNGGRTKGNDFISSNYSKLENDYGSKVKEAIKNGC